MAGHAVDRRRCGCGCASISGAVRGGGGAGPVLGGTLLRCGQLAGRTRHRRPAQRGLRALRQSPAFFEHTRSGEVLSRLTVDTTLVQTVVGSSLSMGLHCNAVMGVGALAHAGVDQPWVMVQVLGVLVLVVLPSVWFGRRVRRLSRASQDRVADSSAIAAEVLNAIPVVQSYVAEARARQRLTSRPTTPSTWRCGAAARARCWSPSSSSPPRRAAVGPVPGHAGRDGRAHQRRPPGPDRGVRDHPGQRLRHPGRGLRRPAARGRRHRAPDGAAGHRVPDPVARAAMPAAQHGAAR